MDPFSANYVLAEHARPAKCCPGVLQAVQGKKVPQFILGNLGEVILLASLLAAETTLRSQGL